MSENQKQQRLNATPIKNPLLSASVTGLTFDDFPNKPLLLPAAPPIAHAPIPAPVVTPTGLVTREPKSLVTVGSSSLDTETLDEINLNTSNEDNQSTDIKDSNANPLLDPSNQGNTNDSILSQAASSFSALPSVASNVFSTFSKRITAISSRETTPLDDQYSQDSNANNLLAPQLEIQPTYIQQQYANSGISSQIPPPFYAPPPQGGNYFASTTASSTHPDTQDNLSVPEPPRLYTPSEVPPLPTASAAPPPSVGGQNNFRFSSKKKLYAPIPGLSDQTQQPAAVIQPSAFTTPISYDNNSTSFYQQSQLTPQYCAPVEQKSEDRKAASGLFSKISNLAPTGVLQNITGLVQSAAGSLTQTVKNDSAQQFNISEPSQSIFEHQNNYFGAAPPPVTSYFAPSSHCVQSTSQNVPNISNLETNCFVAQSESVGENVNQTNTIPPASALFQNSPANTTLQTDIPLFNPSNFVHQSSTSATLPPLLTNKQPLEPTSQTSSSGVIDPALSTAGQVGVLDPTTFVPPHHSGSVSQIGLNGPSLPPPNAGNVVPPKAAASTSYRLQKGTKLYKNPLTPNETAPIHVTPNQIQNITQISQTPYPTLNPATPQSLPLFTPPPIVGENKTKEQGQNLPLFFSAPAGELQTIDLGQSVPLLTPSFTAEQKLDDQSQVVSFFAPPSTEELKSNDQTQGVPLFAQFNTEQHSSDQKYTSIPHPPTAEAQALNNQNQAASLFGIPALNQPVQSVDLFTPILLKEQTTEDNKQSILAGEQNTNKSLHNVALLPASAEEQQSIESAQVESNLIVPPTKFSTEVQNEIVTNNEKKFEELKNNKLEENILTAENLNRVPEYQNNSSDNQLIIKPIEPVIEEDIATPKQIPTEDPLEQSLQNLSLQTEPEESEILTLPPINIQTNTSKNPYRRGSTTDTSKSVAVQPTLANFFAPKATSGSSDFNFFATLPAKEATTSNIESGINFFSESSQGVETKATDPDNFFANEPNTAVQRPITDFFPNVTTNVEKSSAIVENSKNSKFAESLQQTNVPPPPIGFECFLQPEPTAPVCTTRIEEEQEHTTVVRQEISIETQQPEVVNRFSNYFNQTQNQIEVVKDPSTFFDSFPGQTSQQRQLQTQRQQQAEASAISSAIANNEEQRIQYFFNNPPPKEADRVGDLNYDLVHSGLGVKNLQQRSLTPISNLVEPPSSACSEFSELSNFTAGQKSIAANLSITENSEKSQEKLEEGNTTEILEDELSVNADKNDKSLEDLPEELLKHYGELPEEVLKELRLANMLSADKSTTNPAASVSYKPAVKHWFYKRTVADKQIWMPFSHYDSALLETSLLMDGDDKPNIIAVEGGRYDVNISERKKMSVYWESEPIEVRRCSWFYKAVDSKYVPYEEQTAELLENEYKQAAESGVWHKTIILGMGEQVVFHGPTVIVHFQQQQNADAWGGTTQTTTRPRVVKRDLDDFNIEQGESQKVDHLLFMVHGIGSACDLKLRSVEEVVDDFRTIARQLVQSHYKNSTDLGLVGRVEVLPISWHSHLHSAEMGIDEKLRMITLESIPKLRNFTNDTLLDILFYTSPTYCQKIMNTIVASMNSLYLRYRERHPEFNGGVSLAGHSLGSLILFDLLCHQNPIKESEDKNLENPDQFFATGNTSSTMDSNQLEDKQMSYTMGPAGTGQPFINYGQLIFQPKKFFALGSPIGMFVTIRGIDKLGLDFRLPTCPGFYNIFHPYDPVAYRIEALVNPDLSGVRPVLIPHHKGRKRMHLELKETMTRVSMDLKNRFLDKFKNTLESVNIFGSSTKSAKEAEELMEKEVDKVIQMQIQLEQQNPTNGNDSQNGTSAITRQRTDSVSTSMSDDVVEIDFPLGKLNDSKRIDYVLQEAPLEFINEYIFALSSHGFGRHNFVCYERNIFWPWH
ncbi:hypothetical protein DOY81_003690 [Sarcophaga bullata]|nr:hypothetical protein DOY81_003690 [Sarcophaga bullata]